MELSNSNIKLFAIFSQKKSVLLFQETKTKTQEEAFLMFPDKKTKKNSLFFR